MNRLSLTVVAAAVLAAMTLSACGGDDDAPPIPCGADCQPATATGTAVAETATSTTSTTLAATGTTAAVSATTAAPSAAVATVITIAKVNANTATRAQLESAFAAAGVPNPANWAKEVEEYRPYPKDDPSWAKLRRQLAKYNPGPGVVDHIIDVLEP